MVKSSHLPGAKPIRHREYSITARDTNQGSRHRPQLPFKLPPPFMPNFSLFPGQNAFFTHFSANFTRPWALDTVHHIHSINNRHLCQERWTLQDIALSQIFKAIRAAYLKGFEELVWRVFKTRRGIRLRRPKAF